MTDFNAFNQKIIEEFRANSGKVSGSFEGAPMVLITHKGAKSGVERTTPLVCSRDGDDVIIIASKGGAPKHPSWYHNLMAHKTAHVEIGGDAYDADVVEVHGDERQRLWDAHAAKLPQFNEYRAKTTRTIPVLRLVRR